MTEYVCHSCGVKTTLRRHLPDHIDSVPRADECPVCGEQEEFEYI